MEPTAIGTRQTGLFGHSTRWLTNVTILLRLSRARYVAYGYIPFLVGGVASGRGNIRYAVLGCIAIALREACTTFTNLWTDRVEDAIDHPERTSMCRLVGYDRLKRAAIATGIAYCILVGAMWLTVEMRWMTLALWAGLLMGGIAYSWGLRLKRRPIGSLVTIALATPLLFRLGVNWIRPEAKTALIIALLLVCTLSRSGVKDLANFEGDGQIGFKSIAHWIRSKRGLFWGGLLVASPYLAIGLVVILRLRPTRDLAVLLLAPVALMFFSAYRRARSKSERRAVREFGTFYPVLLVAAFLSSVAGNPIGVAIACAGVTLYLTLASFTHSEQVTVREMFRTTWMVATRPHPGLEATQGL